MIDKNLMIVKDKNQIKIGAGISIWGIWHAMLNIYQSVSASLRTKSRSP